MQTQTQSRPSVTDLYDRYPESDIYIVGTGSSMRVFPTEFLADKITIGLNMAWKLLPVKYGITIRPELNIPEFMAGETPRPEIQWIGKYEKFTTPEQRAYADAHPQQFYYFKTGGKEKPINLTNIEDPPGRITEWAARNSGDYLYLWTSIAQTAMNLAANMGARNVIMVGCNNCALNENHHAHEQHTLWNGVAPEFRYDQYYRGMAEVRSALKFRGVNVFTLTPFLGLDNPHSDFALLCQEQDKPLFVDNPDITPQVTLPPRTRTQKMIREIKRLLPFQR